MAKTCPHCSSTSIEVDKENCTEVCVQCGAVLGEDSLENETTSAVPCFSSYGTTLEAYDWRIKQWNAAVHPRGKKYIMTKNVKVQVEKLRLPKEYIPQVVGMMGSVCDGRRRHIKKLPKRNDPLIAACIVIVCRANGVVMDYKNAAEAADCGLFEVSRCAKLIRRSLNMEVTHSNTQDHILDTILTQFGVENSSTKDLAYGLKNFLDDTFTGVTKNKVNFLISVAQLCIECTQKHKINPIKFQEVCRHFICTPRQVTTSFHTIKAKLVKYGKQIPWIKHIENSTLHFYIKEIVEYYRDCEDHRKVGVKTDIMERTEKAESEKKQLIQDAKIRVDVCQKNCTKKKLLTDDDIMHKQCKRGHFKPDILDASHGTSPTKQETPSQQEQTPCCESHRCCPHCCLEPQRCPKYKQTGKCDFCDISSTGRMIEYLLRNGYSESSLIQGYPKAMFEEMYYQGSKREDEELDEDDIDDVEIYKYIKTSDEMAQSHIHSMFLEDEENDNSK